MSQLTEQALAHPAASEPRVSVETVEGGSEAAGANPVELIVDRMHRKWGWMVLLAVLLMPVLGYLGWRFAPVNYTGEGIVAVERRPDVTTIETPETARLDDLSGFVGEQAVLLRSERVLQEAVRDARLTPYSARLASGGMAALAASLTSAPVKGTGYVAVQVESDDPGFSAASVNAILDAYMRIAGPDPETVHTRKLAANQQGLIDIRRAIKARNDEKLELLRSTAYGSPNLNAIIEDRVKRLLEREQTLAELEASVQKILDSRPADAPEPTDDATLEPTTIQLEQLNPTIPQIRRDFDAARAQLEQAKQNFGEKHQAIQQLNRQISMLESRLSMETANARARWQEGLGRTFQYGELKKRIAATKADIERIRTEVGQLTTTLAQTESLQREITQLDEEESLYLERIKELELEKDAIRKGRVSVRQYAIAPTIPSKDKRVQLGLIGAFGGFGLSFAACFLWGTLDRRAFATRQLTARSANMLLAGAIPDMESTSGETDARDLATNCVHRIRTRIESRRTPGDGYAIMVSSPFQGDGKTTVAVALAWSYAESGHKTILVDCDFIAQALSFQFGHLGSPGVREVLQGTDALATIVRIGDSDLSLLPVGRDRTFGASRVRPAGLRRLFHVLRARYEIIIVDTGPMTASVEALPVASSVDGVLLSLRRGRNRTRLDECIAEIGSTGAEYLGVVLNCADRKDCMRYGSISRLSADINLALSGQASPTPPPHALLDAIVPRTLPSADSTSSGAA